MTGLISEKSTVDLHMDVRDNVPTVTHRTKHMTNRQNIHRILLALGLIAVHMLILTASFKAMVWLVQTSPQLTLIVIALLISNFLWEYSEWIFKGIHNSLLGRSDESSSDPK